MMEWIEYGAWGRCARLANEEVELVVTSELGPRIIRFGFIGEANEFAEFPEQRQEDPNEWHIYGGHRLWHAPEAKPRSYAPDNVPVRVRLRAELRGEAVDVQAPVEASTGIQKELRILLNDAGPDVRVIHYLTNRGVWPVTLAPWALSVMRTGGVAVVPQPQAKAWEDLLPNRAVALWPYTDMKDPRLDWGGRFIRLQHDQAAEQPVKFGINADDAWAAYVNDGRAFVKSFTYDAGATYPDYGSCVECYTAASFLELETLGPLVCLEPGETTTHFEDWLLLRDADASSEERVQATLVPRAREAAVRRQGAFEEA